MVLIAALFVPAVVLACTGFLVKGDDGVLFGNNEDFWNPSTRMWFVPGEDGGYGAVYFGFDDMSPQGGMNEAGLAFDGFATRPKPVTGSGDKPTFEGNFMVDLMAKCATVDEVVEMLSQYNLAMMARFMLMFADATGDSVIIEGDQFIRKNGAFQVVTNFYQSEDPSGKNAYGEGKSCERFEIANDLLGGAKRINIADARKVLNAVHAEGKSRTLYSNIYDLDDRLVYVYSFHDFENEVVIDLAEELKKGARVVDLPTLFPRNFAREAFLAEQEQDMEKRREERGSVEVAAETLERYVGTYTSSAGKFVIELDDGELSVIAPDSESIKLTAASDTEFYEVTLMMDYDVVFQVTGEGVVEGIDVKGSKEGWTFQEFSLERIK
jgi:hypothetical protein